jgi:hypothetical protein
MNKYVGWDLEIHKEIKEGLEWKEIRPLGITCAAAYKSDSDEPLVWYAGSPGDPVKDKMTVEEVKKMASDLMALEDDGYKIVTWNGLQFDFDVLSEESGDFGLCSDLAWNHIDIMFQFFCTQGYFVGLKYASQLMLRSDKTEGMSGALAPQMWQGSKDDRLKTIEYVIQDAKLTVDLAKAIDVQSGLFGWITQRGRPKWIRLGELLSCKDSLLIPEPDTSWMSNPKKREEMYQWMQNS